MNKPSENNMPWARTDTVGNSGHAVCAEVHGLGLSFGGQDVWTDLNFSLRVGEIVLLKGENGAGKSALLNVLSGYLRPNRGTTRMLLHQRWVDVTRADPGALARAGLGRLWQDIRLFPSMTALDNVLSATPGLSGLDPIRALWARQSVNAEERRSRDRALSNLALLGIAERASSSCDMLSVGQMKRVALARLLQMEAEVLLLDEPLAGMDESSAESFTNQLSHLAHVVGRTILVIEHRAKRVEAVSDRVLRLAAGRIEEVPVVRD